MTVPGYTGRFAPTPSGPLHFGSIAAALGSFTDARAHGGRWIVRIDDLDAPRVREGAEHDILETLRALGLEWDGTPSRQQGREPVYGEAIDRLRDAGLLYPCICTRRETSGRIYDGHCRARNFPEPRRHAVRIRTDDALLEFGDFVQGKQRTRTRRECGDFIVLRADGIHAYHLATVLDDAARDVTHVVRGADLLASTPQQVLLQHHLGLNRPVYGHLPMAVDDRGKKLSKRDRATQALLRGAPAQLLHDALAFLGQSPEPGLARADVPEVIDWGIANWRREAVPRTPSVPPASVPGI